MAPPLEYAEVDTPIGTFRVVYEGRSVKAVDLLERGLPQSPIPEGATEHAGTLPPGSPPRQFHEYFSGKRRSFDVAVEPLDGAPFDRAVWTALSAVPSGATVSYGELARRAGYPGAARAVGGSMRRNPVPIIVPCHRVVGEDGTLTGFGLGLWRKRWLLDKEGAWPLKARSAEGPTNPHQRTLDRAMARPRSAKA
jgi:methylated-DNA-[protein]-cysteine S-methyltransferase